MFGAIAMKPASNAFLRTAVSSTGWSSRFSRPFKCASTWLPISWQSRLVDVPRHSPGRSKPSPSAGWSAGSDRLAAMARFRSLLVHGYADIVPEQVWEIVTNHLGDIEVFFGSVARWLQENDEESTSG